MSDWPTPPPFEQDGAPPPVRSVAHLLPHVYTGRPGPKLGSSAVRALVSGNYQNHEEFGDVLEWLTENIGSSEFWGAEFEKRTKSATRLAKSGFAISLLVPPAFFFGVGLSLAALGRGYIDSRREILRFERRAFWERDDPVTYVAPDATASVTTSYSTGLSTTASQELAVTIGTKSGVNIKLSGAVSISGEQYSDFTSRLVAWITNTETVVVSRTNTFANQLEGKTRIFAIWKPVVALKVSCLILSRSGLGWQDLGKFEYYTNAGMATTSSEILA